ncbi:MAG TPA: ABC transporter permease [Candidatus Paceibacterota bacterium]|nr:ABC transporter permease [Verrucomicrobiota bacterium]HSA11869.1 ABC transporter permease [Candidatus Paceibacterota bacterium]
MTTLRSVGVVYRKELLDSLRDRRTIISMIVVPLIAIPALTLGMGVLAVRLVTQAQQEIPRVMVLGGEDSTQTLAALRALKTIQVVPASQDYTNLISNKKVRAAVEIPAGFDDALRTGEKKTVHIYIYEGEMKSSFGAQPIEEFFRQLSDRTLSKRLAAHNFPERLLKPFDIRQTNVAPPKKVSGNLLGAFIPYLLILMCMTGAIYPSVDLTAGEKERGTIETLLCSPVARTHLVYGKCLMVLTASLVTTLLSLCSLGASFALVKRLATGGGREALPLPLTMDLSSLAAVFVMMLPMALLFSAVMLAIGLFSRTTKEAHSYLQPLLLVTIMPAVASMLPGVELNSRLAVIPVVNLSLVSKEILSGTFHWNYIALIFASTCIYAAGALAAAVAMFKREGVLFRT